MAAIGRLAEAHAIRLSDFGQGATVPTNNRLLTPVSAQANTERAVGHATPYDMGTENNKQLRQRRMQQCLSLWGLPRLPLSSAATRLECPLPTTWAATTRRGVGSKRPASHYTGTKQRAGPAHHTPRSPHHTTAAASQPRTLHPHETMAGTCFHSRAAAQRSYWLRWLRSCPLSALQQTSRCPIHRTTPHCGSQNNVDALSSPPLRRPARARRGQRRHPSR